MYLFDDLGKDWDNAVEIANDQRLNLPFYIQKLLQ